jgi:hypothetical protein
MEEELPVDVMALGEERLVERLDRSLVANGLQ